MKEPVGASGRRDFLVAATALVGGVGLAAAAVPFLEALGPSSDLLEGGVLDVDLSGVRPGELRVVLWRKQPVFVLRRTPEMIERAVRVRPGDLRDPASPAERAKDPQWLVCLGICTHLGCLPTLAAGNVPGADQPGFYCPCHGGKYDSLGRRLDGPPPENLHLVPYEFAGPSRVRIGAASFAGFGENVRKVGDLPKG